VNVTFSSKRFADLLKIYTGGKKRGTARFAPFLWNNIRSSYFISTFFFAICGLISKLALFAKKKYLDGNNLYLCFNDPSVYQRAFLEQPWKVRNSIYLSQCQWRVERGNVLPGGALR